MLIELLILYFLLSHKKFLPVEGLNRLLKCSLLALHKSTGAIEMEIRFPNHHWQEEESDLDWLFFVKQGERNGLKFWCRGKWAKLLEDYTWCFWSWRGILCSLGAYRVFSQWNTIAGTWKTGSKKPQIGMRVIIGKKPCFQGFMGKECHLVIVKEQSSLIYAPTSLWKNDAMSKSPCILFQCICFLFIKSFGK